MIEDRLLGRIGAIRHGFFTRQGGVSGGIYASLNCGFGSDDSSDNVAENRRRAMNALDLPATALRNVYQVHGTSVAVIERDGGVWNPPKADALVTDVPGVALGILTADCAPILFADAEARVIGAAHAGWRGALMGVAEATVAAMECLGAARARICAAVGPAIAQKSYEVGPEFPGRFAEDGPDTAKYFVPSEREGRFMFDLEAYVVARLGRLGIGQVSASGRDTCAEAETLFSYRRATLRGEPDYGRALSAIAIDG